MEERRLPLICKRERGGGVSLYPCICLTAKKELTDKRNRRRRGGKTDPLSSKCPATCFQLHLWGSSLHTHTHTHRCQSDVVQYCNHVLVGAGGYRGSGVNSLMMPSAPSVTPWTMNVLPMPFHRAFTPWSAQHINHRQHNNTIYILKYKCVWTGQLRTVGGSRSRSERRNPAAIQTRVLLPVRWHHSAPSIIIN